MQFANLFVHAKVFCRSKGIFYLRHIAVVPTGLVVVAFHILSGMVFIDGFGEIGDRISARLRMTTMTTQYLFNQCNKSILCIPFHNVLSNTLVKYTLVEHQFYKGE